MGSENFDRFIETLKHGAVVAAEATMQGINIVADTFDGMVETGKVKFELAKLKDKRKIAMSELGNRLYSMIKNDCYERAPLDEQYDIIAELDAQIQKLTILDEKQQTEEETKDTID